ncbi:alpha-amylase family glycosyl hydrolase [Massilia glaciei]|uniref:DUF3459 domain-containing protein n=1 Tax=Massilia glaciei TaxID=1524097 RepID=A0A2U2HHK3_9BURK|nr:alpha-amylase family glycosyl hydrolase [Massilia glaciei]PWF45397.1 DUF3459 domain-containing protein [Massilia glaciei]
MNQPEQHQPALRPHKSAGGIRFTFDGAPGLRSVAVAGTFNSWVGDDRPLRQIAPGRWQTTLPVATGRHLYKYVVDGRHWILDPANPWVSEDGQNNSSFTVDGDGEVFIRSGHANAQHPGPLYLRHKALPSPAWLADGVVYQLSVRAFGATFAGVQARLDHLAALGVGVIWMMPIHPVGIDGRLGTLGDPYAVRDFGAIDPALGDAAALRALVDAIHARGMRLVLDWTLNRASVDNILVAQHPDWFTRRAGGAPFYAVPNRAYFAGLDFSRPDLRAHLLGAMRQWVAEFDIDGFRFDDSDITPLDFLVEIRESLRQIRPDIGLISQAYDEFHHLAACDLTYEGGTRDLILALAGGRAAPADFIRQWQDAAYSFPRDALRMRWLEEKEQGRAWRHYGPALHLAAAAILLTVDGVPHLMMGQEFNEPLWRDWRSLFEPFSLDWSAFDAPTLKHYQCLIGLRNRHPALRQGKLEFAAEQPDGALAYWRGSGAARILVVVNLSARAARLPACAHGLQCLYTSDRGHQAGERVDPARGLAAHVCLLAQAAQAKQQLGAHVMRLQNDVK